MSEINKNRLPYKNVVAVPYVNRVKKILCWLHGRRIVVGKIRKIVYLNKRNESLLRGLDLKVLRGVNKTVKKYHELWSATENENEKVKLMEKFCDELINCNSA